MISNLLKEVYEKGKVRKMATDGQVDTNAGDNFRNGKKPPPFAKKTSANDAMAKAKQNAVQSRLAKMKANSKGK